jgi:hypothetical protein
MENSRGPPPVVRRFPPAHGAAKGDTAPSLFRKGDSDE